MDLLPFFQWCYTTPIGEGIRNSTWIFPVLEALHLLGFGVTAGAVLLVDLRLLGIGLRKQPVDRLWANARPWLIGAVTLMFCTGIPLFMSESLKAYYSIAFWIKMVSLFLVLILTFTALHRATQTGASSDQPPRGKLVAIVSLCLWIGVAWGGRWIGFGG